MKKLTIILLCITIFSCDVEEEKDSYIATGTYKLVAAGKFYKESWGDQNQYSADRSIDLYNHCSRNSTITINRNGTFEIMEFVQNEEICESSQLTGTWVYKELVYNNVLGEFEVNNSNRVYEVFSTGINSDFTVNKIDVTYGSTLATPSGRYIYTYQRIN